MSTQNSASREAYLASMEKLRARIARATSGEQSAAPGRRWYARFGRRISGQWDR